MSNTLQEDRVARVFQTPNHKAFITFLTAGDPTPDCTVEYILEMERAGADLIEIGIPFSDPTAESPVIQDAFVRALRRGMTTDGVFDIVRRVREKAGECPGDRTGEYVPVPLAFMTYANPVFHYGTERFFARCEELEVAAVIIPDLPYEEKQEMEGAAEAHNVALVSMVAHSSRERIRQIACEAKGFIYVVSSMGINRGQNETDTELKSTVESIREVTDVPCAIVLDVSTPREVRHMARVSDGAIVGSAIEMIIARDGERAASAIYRYVRQMKEAVAQA